jgi:hypothetical protein
VCCIVNYGVVLLPGVVSLMSTTRENCIKGKRTGDRSQSSEHLRPGISCILRRITRSVNILYFYVEFCINLHIFLFDYMTVIIEYCLVNYGVVQLLVVSSISGWSTGVLLPLGMADTKPQRRRLTTQQHMQRPVTTPRLQLGLQLHHQGSRYTTAHSAPSYYTEGQKFYSSPSYPTKSHVHIPEAPKY